MKTAICLLSGGLDSATVLYYARSKGYRCLCLSFDYGQRHKREIKAAKAIASKAKCAWRLIKIDLPWKGSSLLDRAQKIPSGRSGRFTAAEGIPNTYVPARNIIFLSFAVSYAEAAGAEAVFIGANAVDYSGYPDCRPEFFRAFKNVIKKGTKKGSGIEISAPLIDKSKKEIVKLAHRLKAPVELTWSCYKGAKRPCGVCDSCALRAAGFKDAGIKDGALRG